VEPALSKGLLLSVQFNLLLSNMMNSQTVQEVMWLSMMLMVGTPSSSRLQLLLVHLVEACSSRLRNRSAVTWHPTPFQTAFMIKKLACPHQLHR
jgi:hypothetical protein